MTEYDPDRISILGTSVSRFNSLDQVVGLIRRRIKSRLPTFCVAINPEKVQRARCDPKLGQVLNAAHVQICDGVGVALAAKFLYGENLSRCTGIDLFLELVTLAAAEDWSIFLLGASPESNAGARRALAARFPGLKIAGNQHGYFQDSSAILERINSSGADLLFVAMGSPRQEFWISEHLPQLKTCFCMGIGGSLDVLSGRAKRAPVLFRRTGTEWLFRLLAQPSRIRRQSMLPLFALDVLRNAAGSH